MTPSSALIFFQFSTSRPSHPPQQLFTCLPSELLHQIWPITTVPPVLTPLSTRKWSRGCAIATAVSSFFYCHFDCCTITSSKEGLSGSTKPSDLILPALPPSLIPNLLVILYLLHPSCFLPFTCQPANLSSLEPSSFHPLSTAHISRLSPCFLLHKSPFSSFTIIPSMHLKSLGHPLSTPSSIYLSTCFPMLIHTQ